MSCSIHLAPVVAHIRVYADGGNFAEHSPYTCIMTMTYLSGNTVYIGGAHGRLSHTVVKEIGALLKAEGIKRVTYRRAGVDVEVDL